jgi:hypothetical protein
VYSETFAAAGARTGSTISVLNGSASDFAASASDFGGGVSLSYDAGTGGYTVRDAGGASATFEPKSINKTATDKSNGRVTVYQLASEGTSDDLVLYNTGAANPELKLSYVSYGAWQHVSDNGSTLAATQQYFVYGIRQGADQPSTGSASYTTTVDGLWTNPDGVYSLAGTSQFTADFAAKTVATSLNLGASRTRVDGTIDSRPFGRIDGTGTIAALGGGFGGTMAQVGAAGDGHAYSGTFNGAFFGPHGEEMGYTFSLTSPGGVVAGAVVGKGN